MEAAKLSMMSSWIPGVSLSMADKEAATSSSEKRSVKKESDSDDSACDRTWSRKSDKSP